MSLDTSQSNSGSGNFQPPLQAGPGAPAATSDTTLSEALITLRKRRLILITTVLLGGIYGFYKSTTQVKLYEAYGRIEIRSGSANEYRVNPYAGFEDDPQQKMLSEIAILTSDTLLTTVGREMNLANTPEFLGVKGPVPHRSMEDPGVRQGVVGTLQGSLKVALVPKTDLIRISYSSLSPKLSADIVNTLIRDYRQRSYETRFDSTRDVSVWLSSQLDDLKNQVEASQRDVLNLGKQLGTLGFDSTHNQIATSLDALASASGTAKLARIVAETRYRQLTSMDPSSMESSIDAGPGGTPGALTSLRANLAQAQATLARDAVQDGPNLPQFKSDKANVEQLQKAIDSEQTRLLTQAKENYLIAKANEDQTTAALDSQKQQAYGLRDEQVEYTVKLRDFESNRTLYEGLLQKLRTAGVEAGLESLEIDIVDPAVPQTSPIMKSQSSIMLTYLFLGLVAGVLIAFLLESLDNGLRSIAEIESITELPSLAIIPRARRATAEQTATMTTVQRNVNVLTQPKSQFTEAFRSLRTALLLSSTGREPRIILFTSATPSEGKTTAASNLAVILAQRGTRVLLIDGDLRRPNMHHRFGLNGKVGLSTVLSGQTTLEDSVQAVAEVPGLDILASGPVPPFPTEMLSSNSMKELLLHARDIYSHIVIDSPPILSVTDGVILSYQVDAVVLVVRHGKSSKHIVRRGRDLLVRSGAPIAGIVLNAVDLNAPEYYGYYGYTGYSYSSLDVAGWDAKGKGKTRRSSSQQGDRS